MLDSLGAIILQFCRGIAGVITGDNNVPVSWRLGFAVLAVSFLIAARRLVLALNARKPGPVEVKQLSNAAGDTVTQSRLDDLSAQLTEHLSKAHLRPPTVLPIQPPAETFLDLLGDVSSDAKSPWPSILRVLSRIRPRVAYRITGVLQARQPEPKYGITVTLTAFALGDSRVVTLWGSNWEETVRDAGCWAMAAILPVTKYCKRPPWQDWRGRDLPWQLFRAYQQAKEYSSSRRFDDALNCYYEALKLDPMNSYLRAEIASTQVQLGLYIDALDSYEGAMARDGQRPEEYDARLWASTFHGHNSQFFHYLLLRPDAILIRYRYAQIVGYSGQTAHQWCSSGGGSRAGARKEIRDRLIPVLARRYWPILATPDVQERARVYRQLVPGEAGRNDGDGFTADDYIGQTEELLRKPLQPKLSVDARDSAERAVRVFFQEASLQEMARMHADRRLAVINPESRRGVTLYSFRIWRYVLGPLRLAYARNDYGRETTFLNDVFLLKKEVDKTRKWWERVMYVIWDQPWQDHYNAACVYAFAMNRYDDLQAKQPDPLSPAEEASLTKLQDWAIAELEEAARCAESGFITRKQWWMLSNDPDLAILRGYDKFAQFEQRTFPSIRSAGIRPPKAVSIDLTAYDHQLIAGVAEMMEPEWHRRGRCSAPDIHTVIGWFKSELKVWECLERMCANEARHWPDRHELLHAVDLAASDHLLSGSQSHPQLFASGDIERTFRAEPNFPRSKLLDQQAYEHAHEIDAMMDLLSGNAKEAVEVSRAWITRLEREDELGRGAIPATTVQEVCSEYAAAWQHVGKWFARGDLDPARRASARADLKLALRRVHETGLHQDWKSHLSAAIRAWERATERVITGHWWAGARRAPQASRFKN